MVRFHARRLVTFTGMIALAFVTACYVYGMRPYGHAEVNIDAAEIERRLAVVREQMPPGGEQQRHLATEMEMVSDMKTTVHLWLWTDTKDIMNACAKVDYENPAMELPQASVIVSFCDHENVSVLLHTVHSIVQRTPSRLLKEIILIDDNTRKAEMKELLQNYVNAVFRGTTVRIHRSTEQLGLIRARLTGIRMANARVVVSMDSHMEVQQRWLEPLLHEIAINKKTLAGSCLDWIEKKDGAWEYRHGGSMWRTYFDWAFVFGFQRMSEASVNRRKTQTEPVSSPVTIGTIFAIEKEFFEDIGAFDEGMLLWGGENIDLPIRVWLFGGRVLNVPCSRAAHLEYPNNRRYREGWEPTIHRNYKRFAEVWLDDYKQNFYDNLPQLRVEKVGDLSSRLALKKRAKHDFAWYLKHVYPELGLPRNDSFAWGKVQNIGSMLCLVTEYSTPVRLEPCSTRPEYQGFYWSVSGHLRLPIHIVTMQEPLMNEPDREFEFVEYMSCYNTTYGEKFVHWRGGPIIDIASGKCLDTKDSERVVLRTCNSKRKTQLWKFPTYTAAYRNMLANRDGGRFPEMNHHVKRYQAKFQERLRRTKT